jgi:hypothetical protein
MVSELLSLLQHVVDYFASDLCVGLNTKLRTGLAVPTSGKHQQ